LTQNNEIDFETFFEIDFNKYESKDTFVSSLIKEY